MATQNFHNVNANNIFAVEIQDEWDYDDLIENLKHEVDYLDDTRKDEHELRSFPSRVIGCNYTEKLYTHFRVELELTVVVRSGYYSGVNLDWTPTFNIDGEEFEDLDDITEHLTYYYDFTEKQAARYTEWLKTWHERELESLVERTEQSFRYYTTPLGITAVFSNGEAMYHEVA
jgi:hypothetical protein